MRKKLTIAYITNDHKRKASFRKRKKGLIKKLTELCTLCGVQACFILYSPYESGPVLWPNLEAVHAVLERFKTVPSLERFRKMANQESYNKTRIKNCQNQLCKIHKENRMRKLEIYISGHVKGDMMTLDLLDIRDIADMGFVIDKFLRDVDIQINKLKRQNGEGTSNVVEAATDVTTTMEAPTPLIHSLDLSISLGMYGANDSTTFHQENNMDYTNELIIEPMINNNNNVIPNSGASNEKGFMLLGYGFNTWNTQLVGFNAGTSDGGDRKDDGNWDDDVDFSLSSDDDSDDDDDDDDNEDEDDEGN